MGQLSLQQVSTEGFGISAELLDGCLVLALRGTGDLNAIEPLSAYLESAWREVEELGIARVVFDVRELEFMNSSCFKAFVTFIERSKARGGVALVFRTEPLHHWQRRSLEALRRLAMGVVTIER